MSYDLNVEYTAVPNDLRTRWEALLLREGFRVEILPDFEPKTWEGGFLPMRLTDAPEALIGMKLPSDAVAGFEVSFDKRNALFRFGNGAPTTEIATMCVGAALLAELSNGRYIDPQSGAEARAPACIALARTTAQGLLVGAKRVHHPFPGWAALNG